MKENWDDIMEYLVVERMGHHITEFRKNVENKESDAAKEKENYQRYNEISHMLPEDKRLQLNDCLDALVNLASKNEELYYRAGLKDGMCIREWVEEIQKNSSHLTEK